MPDQPVAVTPYLPAVLSTSANQFQSLDISEVSGGLAKAQGEFKPLVCNKKVEYKTRNGDVVKYSYASLNECFKVSRPALAKNNLAVVQTLQQSDTKLLLITQLVHSSGQWLRSAMRITVDTSGKLSPIQATGSAITYLRRYAYSALIGLASEEDDDGQGASEASIENFDPEGKNGKKKVAKHEPPSEAQISRLYTIATKSNYNHSQVLDFIKWNCNVDSTKELTYTQYDDICKYFQANPNQSKAN